MSWPVSYLLVLRAEQGWLTKTLGAKGFRGLHFRENVSLWHWGQRKQWSGAAPPALPPCKDTRSLQLCRQVRVENLWQFSFVLSIGLLEEQPMLFTTEASLQARTSKSHTPNSLVSNSLPRSKRKIPWKYKVEVLWEEKRMGRHIS